MATTLLDYIVFIGRFQPIHRNHEAMIRHAFSKAKNVIILLGSANRPRTIKNPFTVNERIAMIMSAFPQEAKEGRIFFSGINDSTYNDQRWAMNVQSQVDTIIDAVGDDPDSVKIGITGNKDDFTSYYIDMFPQWEYVGPKNLDRSIAHIHASDIRNLYFEGITLRPHIGYMSEPVYNFLMEFKDSSVYRSLVKEHEYIKKYKESWAVSPYPVTFVTVDALVIQSGHILVVKRRAEPGKGLLALPGGFLDQKERIIDGMIRELREETKIKVPAPVLRGCIQKRNVYDDVERSARGRTITNAFLIELPAGPLPRVKGADDAEKAFWMPIADLRSEEFFEDHFDMICDMLGI